MKRTISLIVCLMLLVMTLCACGEGKVVSKDDAAATAPVESETQDMAETEPKGTISQSTDGAVEVFDYKAEYKHIIDVYERDYGTIPEGDVFTMESALYYANLVDFDKSGTPELVLGHISNTEEKFEAIYTIFGVTDNSVQCIETGDMHMTGGPDPSIILCYTEDEVYFVTGTSQSYAEKDYRRLSAGEFESVFSYSQDSYVDETGDIECELQGEKVSYSDLLDAIDEFKKDIEREDNFFIGWDMNETRELLHSTKEALNN